ncbi:MAG: PaaI family thioesterase [Microthrixaceae bacterium]|nr:PaaI family thioesterase [Microthrixaceae bacterium]
MSTRAQRFDLLPSSVLARWEDFLKWDDRTYFPQLLGITVEELRRDYARMRLPWRSELNQPQGLMHGGAISTLIDTVVVPAIGTAYSTPRPFSTIEMSVRYLGPVRKEDLVAEGWVTRRGKRVVFCDVEVTTSTSVVVASGHLIYIVGSETTAEAAGNG